MRDVHFDDVWAELLRARWGWLVACVAVATAAFPIRALRWRYLLRIEGAPVPLAPLWHATAVGFMINNVVGARTGEIARPFMLGRLTGVRFSTALGSVGVERILDGVTLVGLLIVAAAAGGFDPATRVGGVTLGSVATGATVIFGGLLVMVLAAMRWPHHILGLAERTLRAVLPHRLADKLHAVIGGLVEGLEALGAPGHAAPALLWSAVHWTVATFSWWLAFVAFGIDVPWSAALMVQALLAFGVALPAAPGFFGVFEAVVKATLILYGIGEASAVSLAIGYHVATWVPITALGFWSLARTGFTMRDLRSSNSGTAA